MCKISLWHNRKGLIVILGNVYRNKNCILCGRVEKLWLLLRWPPLDAILNSFNLPGTETYFNLASSVHKYSTRFQDNGSSTIPRLWGLEKNHLPIKFVCSGMIYLLILLILLTYNLILIISLISVKHWIDHH